MRKAFTYSFLFHLGIVVVALIGIPASELLPVEDIETMDVDIADLTVTTKNRKPPPPLDEPEAKEVQATKPPPPPPPKPRPAPPPEPEPEPEPAPEAPEAVDAPPEPEPAPPEPPEEKQVALVTPTAKPRPKNIKKKNDFDDMLNNLALDDDQPADAPDKKSTEKDFFDELNLDEIETAEKPAPREKTQLAPIIGTRLTVSEEDSLRRHIEPCWNVQIGARNPEELAVLIRLYINRDGTVRKAEVVDKIRMGSDRFYRAAAEAAMRAVLNKRCQPLPIPPGKYEQLKVFTYNFDPSKMVGR